MRGQLARTIAFVSFLILSNAQAADLSAPQAGPVVQAVWVPRNFSQFSPPALYVPSNGYESNTTSLSCDQLSDRTTQLLKGFGARDIHIDGRGCYSATRNSLRTLDLTFSVLVPLEERGKAEASAPVPAVWQVAAFKADDLGDCAFLNYVTRKVLPLFSTRNLKLIPAADCKKIGLGLYTEILRERH